MSLRKKYEMKINELFILHREVETRYKRAVEEIIKVDFLKEDLNSELILSKGQLDSFKKICFQSNVTTLKQQKDLEYLNKEVDYLREREQVKDA